MSTKLAKLTKLKEKGREKFKSMITNIKEIMVQILNIDNFE